MNALRALLVVGMSFPVFAKADVTLASLFQDNMVLQQLSQAPVWGWADPGETISLGGSWPGSHASAIAAHDGRWMARVQTPAASGPHILTIKGHNTIVLQNVLIGEVWVCSGQSNMAAPFYREKKVPGGTIIFKITNHEQERLAANYPEIRLFRVSNNPHVSRSPMATVAGQWLVCSPTMAEKMPAVPYFFGRELHRELNVPVGLIVNAISATQIESWINEEGIAAVPEVKIYLKEASKSLKHPPSALYNANVHALVPFAIRGAIWYQGESNRGDHMIYYQKMKALINGWRTAWKQGEFPFYFVQLAPCNSFYENEWELPMLWEAQAAALGIAHTGMAATSDISDLDLHPPNKQEVGKRLALQALARDYGRIDTVFDGPRYKSMQVDGKRIRLTFNNYGGKLMSRDGNSPDCFEIAGLDRIFKPATAQIDGDTVVVYNDSIDEPVAVRFGWRNDARSNLMNAEGFPAYPFRTDAWPADDN